MNLNIFKKAFSLTELLIVLVIVAVLFSAMLPIMTKRKTGSTSSNEPVWMFVNEDDQKDAFYDPGTPTWTSTAFIGVDPLDIADTKPYSKVVLKAKKNQDMIQFRYGNNGNGTLAGVFTIDNKGNIITSGRLNGDKNNNYNSILENGVNNTIAGMTAAEKLKGTSDSTAVGARAMMGKMNATPGTTTAIGRDSALYARSENSLFVGANTGKAENTVIHDSVAVGAGNLGLNNSAGTENVLVGYNTGAVGFSGAGNEKNTILNSRYYGESPMNNTIIGSGVYEGGHPNARNLTAVGVGACDSYNTTQGSGNGRKTCIGYRAAYNFGTNNATQNLGWEKDVYDHIFIGGKPYGGIGGRSILEVHNIPRKASLTAKPQLGPTVVMNSNLVVRGNLYFPSASSGDLFSLQPISAGYETGTESGKDRCGRRCIGGRKKFRDSKACSWLANLIGALVVAVAIAGAFWTGGASLGVIIGTGLGGFASGGVGAAAIFGGKDYKRNKDPYSMSSLAIVSTSGSCGSGNYPSTNSCPNLGLSDIRLKENISENTDAINKILYVMPYNYTFKADKDSTPQVGVMAQDLQKYFPESVSEGKDGYLGIRWDEMFFATINAVKELDTKVQANDKDIESLEKDTKLIANNQKSIQKRIADIDKRINKLEK